MRCTLDGGGLMGEAGGVFSRPRVVPDVVGCDVLVALPLTDLVAVWRLVKKPPLGPLDAVGGADTVGAVGASSPPRWLGKMLRAVVGAGIAPRLSVVGSTADLPEPPEMCIRDRPRAK